MTIELEKINLLVDKIKNDILRIDSLRREYGLFNKSPLSRREERKMAELCFNSVNVYIIETKLRDKEKIALEGMLESIKNLALKVGFKLEEDEHIDFGDDDWSKNDD